MKFEKLFDELIEEQRKKLMKLGSVIVPNLTEEDILQPNDFPELESNPLFRYEEGVLEGMMTAKTAVIVSLQDTGARMRDILGIDK